MAKHDIGAAVARRRVIQAAQAAQAEAPPPPLPLRVDDDESYGAFLAECAPGSVHYADLVESVRALERAFDAHVSDGHGGGAADILGDISRLREAVLSGDGSIPLSLAPEDRGKVRCWRAGDQICCSIRVKAKNSAPRILTTVSPVADHVRDAAAYARDAGVDEVEALGYLPELALVIGGGKVLTRLKRAAASAFDSGLMVHPDVTDGTPTTVVGEISPDDFVRFRGR